MRPRLRRAGEGVDRHHAARAREPKPRRFGDPCRFHARPRERGSGLFARAPVRGGDHRAGQPPFQPLDVATRSTWSCRCEGSGLAYEPGDSLGLLAGNDPALVDDVLRIAGLDQDDALRAAFAGAVRHHDADGPQIAAYATLVGDAALAAIGADAARAAAFRADRQFIDLLAAAPHRLTAEQLTGLLRPLAPRLYSVASSRRLVGEAAHLLVGEVAWQSHGRERRGVASGEVAARRRSGDHARVYVQANRHFRLPEEADRPIIMIGPGTGVAPFRAFMQESEASGTIAGAGCSSARETSPTTSSISSSGRSG